MSFHPLVFFCKNIILRPFLGDLDHLGSIGDHQDPWSWWGSVGVPFGAPQNPQVHGTPGGPYHGLGGDLSKMPLGHFLGDYIWVIHICIREVAILHHYEDIMPSSYKKIFVGPY